MAEHALAITPKFPPLCGVPTGILDQWKQTEPGLSVTLLSQLPKVDGGDVFTTVCLTVTSICQNVLDGLWQNLDELVW